MQHSTHFMAPQVGDIKLSTKCLLTDWMDPKLAETGFSRGRLCKAMGISQALLTNYRIGLRTLTSEHAFEMANFLRATDDQHFELMEINGIVKQLNDVDRLFLKDIRRSVSEPKKRRPKKAHSELADFFETPAKVVEKLINYLALNATIDAHAWPDRSKYHHIFVHLRALLRVVGYINKCLLDDDDNPESILTKDNIAFHLTYPSVLYLGFFLTGVDDSDGPLVGDLIATIELNLMECIPDLESDDQGYAAIAHHAMHVLSRFGAGEYASEYRKKANSRNPETARMALFAQVFASTDGGPAELLADKILRDPGFADVTILFDGLHYGDYSDYLDRKSFSRVPINALMRQVDALLSSKEQIRLVAAARVINMLERFSGRISSDPLMLARVARRRVELEEVTSTEPTIKTAIDALLNLFHSAEKESL